MDMQNNKWLNVLTDARAKFSQSEMNSVLPGGGGGGVKILVTTGGGGGGG